MRAGHLRHRITIQSLTETRDGANRVTGEMWTAVVENVPARIRPKSVKEPLAAAQTAGSTMHVVEIRYHSGVTADMRILAGARILEIVGIRDPEERHRELWIDCIETGAEVGAGSASGSGE